jgi:hypothetical protein
MYMDYNTTEFQIFITRFPETCARLGAIGYLHIVIHYLPLLFYARNPVSKNRDPVVY